MLRIHKPNYKCIVLRCHFAVAYSVLALTSTVWSEELSRNVVIRWNEAALQGVRDSKLGPPMVSRSPAVVHTCVYTMPGRLMTNVRSVRNWGALFANPVRSTRSRTRMKQSALPLIAPWSTFSQRMRPVCFVR